MRDLHAVAKQFDGKACALCPQARPSSPSGEHVWPSWFLEMFPANEAPFTTWVNGEVVRRRDGTPRTSTSFPRVKLPVCIECNRTLNHRFELRAKHPVRQLMSSGGNVVLDPSDAAAVGLWLLKTWLLLSHPAATGGDTASRRISWNLDQAPADLYFWMTTGQPPPPWLSVWVSRRGDEQPGDVTTRHIELPTVVADGHTIACQVARNAVRFLDVSVVYHPYWAIDHPLETEDKAARVWPPRDGEALDFGGLPPVDPRDTCWLEGPTLYFDPGAFEHAALPHLSVEGLGFPVPNIRGLRGGAW